MNSSSDIGQSRQGRFPADTFPPMLRILCADHGEIAPIVALSIVAGAIGASAQVRRQSTKETVAAQMLLVIQSDASHVGCLPALLAPMREFQQGLVADACGAMDAEAIQKTEARLRAQQAKFLANDRFPERGHLAYFDYQLRQVRRQVGKMFFVEQLAEGAILDSLKGSPDGGLFAIWTDSQSFHRNCTYWANSQGKLEGDMMRRGLLGQKFAQSVDDGGTPVYRPYFSGVATCRREELREIIGLDCPLFLPSMPVIVLNADLAVGMAAQPSGESNQVEWWRSLINRLLTARFEQERSTFSLSPGADAILSAAQAEEFRHLWEDYELPPMAAEEFSLKFTLLLHLCQDHPSRQIPEATAASAVKLTSWLVEKHYSAITAGRQETAAEKRRIDCATMLGKIRDKGPISKRDLFRTYRVQRQAVLNPILDDLVGTGQVTSDSDGHLRLSMATENEAKSPTLSNAD
jgi:hypothetical protein